MDAWPDALPCPTMSECADPLHGKVFPCPTCGEPDAGAMVPAPRGDMRQAPGKIAARWTIEEYEASPQAPAHFRIMANGRLIAWGNAEETEAAVALVQLAAAAVKLCTLEQLAAELEQPAPPAAGRPRRTTLVVAGAWRPDPS